MSLSEAVPNWDLIWAGCRKRIRPWRIPSNWSSADWLAEMESEGALAAVKARSGYQADLGMSLPSYIHMKIIGHLVTIYRREWAFAARHWVNLPEGLAANSPPHTALEVKDALSILDKKDRWLLARLFWEGSCEVDIAREMGVTQQAVSKRKCRALLQLRKNLVSRKI